MAASTTKPKEDSEIFENVEFVEPKKKPVEPPVHPFVDNPRKRKEHPAQDEKDNFTQPPPSKRAKTTNHPKSIHPGYSSTYQHQRKTKPSDYYQKKWKEHKNSTNATHYHQPTLQEMENHILFKIAKQNWLNKDSNDLSFDPALVDSLYFDHISSQNEESTHNIIILEFSHYLERYSPFIHPSLHQITKTHTISTVTYGAISITNSHQMSIYYQCSTA